MDNYKAYRELRDASINREGNIKLELTVSTITHPEFRLSNGWKYEFKEKGRLIYASTNIYRISAEDFSGFCKGLLGKMQEIEQEAVQMVELWAAYTALHSLAASVGQKREECDLLEKLERIEQAYEKHKGCLHEFPNEILMSREFLNDRIVLEKARDAALEAANNKKGRSLVIKGIDMIHGFRKNDTMLFDPIDIYYTHDEKGAELRSSLERYATAPLSM